MINRFSDNLEDVIRQLENFLPIKAVDWNDKMGSFNFFAKSELSLHYVEGAKEKKSLPIALTALKDRNDSFKSYAAIYLLREQTLHAQLENTSLIESKEKKSNNIRPIDLTFIHTYLYYDDKHRVSKLANSDLFEYARVYYKTCFDIKDWIAQIALAIYELHSHNIVHRDIKPENILVFVNEDNSITLKLADLDDLCQSNANMHIQGSVRYSAPELCNKWKLFSKKNHFDPINYKKVNKKSADCFTLGSTIYMLTVYYEIKQTNPNVKSLMDNLLSKKPEDRLTIEQVLQHPLFGATDDERTNYFNALKAKHATPETFIDGYYLPPQRYFPPSNNSFLIMPAALKSIYVTAVDLNNKISFIQTKHCQPHVSFEMIKGYYINEMTLQAILKTAHELNRLTKLHPSTSQAAHIIEQLKVISSEAICAAKELLISRIKAITINKLITIVTNALIRYELMNRAKQENSRYIFFAEKFERVFFKQITSERCKAFNLLANLKTIQLISTPRKAFELILEYLDGTIKNEEPDSFPNILKEELSAYSSQPLRGWINHLSDDKKVLELDRKPSR